MLLYKLFVSSVLLIVCSYSTPIHPNNGLEKYNNLLNTCVAQEGASDADRNEVFHRLPPSTVASRCLYTCVLENIGVIQDGRFSVYGAVNVAKHRNMNDETRVAEARSVIEDCADVTGADRCELAMEIVKCTSNAAIARGLNPNGVLD